MASKKRKKLKKLASIGTKIEQKAPFEGSKSPKNSGFGSGLGYGNHGASWYKTGLKSYHPTPTNADDDIVRNLDALRGRARDLYMGSAIASAAVKTMRTNIVGSGLMLNSQIDHKVLGLTPDEAKEWEEATEREWALWSEGTYCDAERKQNFYQLQSLVVISTLLSGDVFVALPMVKVEGCPYDLKVALIEADRVCNPEDSLYSLDKNVLGGVEIGKHGEAVAYYIANRNPRAIPVGEEQATTWERVPAFGAKTGRANILQVMGDVERPGQRRGVPLVSTIIQSLTQLASYTQAELNAADISAKFTVYVKSDTNKSLNLPPPEFYGAGMGMDDRNPRDYQIGNGAVTFLNTGEDLIFADPKRPNANYGAFVEGICRQIGASLEIPYELLMKQFTSSYSASRGALLEAWKMFKMRREWLINSFCQPIYVEWLTEAVAKGRIKAPGFFEDPVVRRAWCGAQWYGDCQGQLDPVKEAQAAALRVQNCFSTIAREAAELTGLKAENIFQIRAQEEEQKKTLKLAPGEAQTTERVEIFPDDDSDNDDEDDSEDDRANRPGETIKDEEIEK